MTCLPIFQRELLCGARSKVTYWTRCAVALAGVLICLQSMNAGLPGTPATLGRYVFNALVAGAFLVSCSVCLLSADAISSERREGTLQLLFLTGVKPADVLLGKAGSVGLASLCSLVAFLPVLVVPLVAGGVTGGEALRKGLALLNLMFFALVAGLCASATQRDRMRACRTAVFLVGLVVLVPFFVLVVARHTVPYYVGLISPLSSTVVAADTYYGAGHSPFWSSLVMLQLLTWGMLAGAGWRLKQAVRLADADGPNPARPEVAQRRVGLLSWEPAKGESNPVEWLVYHRFSVGAGLWGAALLALSYNGWVALAQFPGMRRGTLFAFLFAWPFAVTGGLVGSAIVAWVASRFFAGLRRSGDLELLLTTPVGAISIVSDQWSVLKRLFVWPVLVMQAPMLPQLLTVMSGAPAGGIGGVAGAVVLSKLLALFNIFLGVAALCWVALWLGLKARTLAAAIVWTVALAKGLPSVISLVGLLVVDSSSGGSGVAGGLALWVPEGLNLSFYLWLIWFARRHLLADLASAEPLPVDWQLLPRILQAYRARFRTNTLSTTS